MSVYLAIINPIGEIENLELVADADANRRFRTFDLQCRAQGDGSKVYRGEEPPVAETPAPKEP